MNIFPLMSLAIITASIFAIVGIWFGRRIQYRQRLEGHYEVLVALFQTGGTLHAVFLAFLVVAVWQSYDAARANLAEEASALATLYRVSAGMDTHAGDALRGLVREYVTAVIEDEWTVQAESGGTSPRARAASLAIYRLFGHEDPVLKQNDAVINANALEILSQIQSDRNKRTLEAGQSLPAIIWLAAIGSGMIVLSMSFVLTSQHVVLQMTLTCIIASTIAALLCITLMLSRPFFGPIALKADPFKHSLEVFDAVDATP